MNEDVKDQVELAKKALQKALGHIARIEQLMSVRFNRFAGWLSEVIKHITSIIRNYFQRLKGDTR